MANSGDEAGAQTSQHPTDRLIRELIQTGRDATPAEVDSIIERMATAPFDRSIVRVDLEHRGMQWRGRTLGARADSLAYHLFQRVMLEQQWAEGTTEGQYVGDVQDAARSPEARVAVYERRGGHVAAIVSRTADAVPVSRRGAGSLPDLFIAYSADRGIIVTGYQVSSIETVSIPKEARWLK